MYKILLIEDDVNLGMPLTGALEMQGYKVQHLTNGDRAFETYTNCFNVEVYMEFKCNFYDSNADKNNYRYGGLRISEIANYNTDNTLLGKSQFAYVNPESSNKSSGYITNTATILLEDMSSKMTCITIPSSAGVFNIDKYTTTHLYYNNPTTSIYPNNLSYKQVQVKKTGSGNTNNGVTKYEFRTSWDIYNTGAKLLSSTSHERGQLLKESIFDNTNRLLEETINHYSNHPDIKQSAGKFKLLASIQGIPCRLGSYTLREMYSPLNFVEHSRWCKLDSTIKYNYYDSGTVTNKTEYIYNDTISCQPTTVISWINNNKQRVSVYQYPPQMTDNVSKKMSENHFVNSFLTKEDKLDNVPLFKQTNLYSILPLTVPVGSFENSELFYLDSIRIKHSTYPDRTEMKMKYDLRNNITEYISKTNIPVTCIWSYNYQHIIAKIEGLTYSQVLNYYPQSSIDNLAKTLNPTTDQINAIRAALASQPVLVTTYTYTPLVGITSMTDPRGVTTYYNYDGLGRLINRLDFGKNILQQYQYHYKE